MTITFFLAYVGGLAGLSAWLHWQRAQDPVRYPTPRRLPRQTVFEFAGRQLLFVAVAWATFAAGDWTWRSVGVPARFRWEEVVLVGEVAFLGVILVNLLVLFLGRRLGPMRLTAVRGNLRAWPRRRDEKWIAGIAIMVFNPFVEELVMRGILIHHWGLVLGSPVVPVIVGFGLNGALHWYQGWRMQLWHALFFVAAVTLLYSPWGLPAAMVAHVFGDVLPFAVLRRNLRSAHKARRAAARRTARTAA
ncbi:MAG TPA: CPBP family intramembrane glutamic endopeptidase [Steroidobacteraceae bacterium]|nr:CPBP family intramembrane glutamic endopeptidase [Steroidobacteraceae bacterium]